MKSFSPIGSIRPHPSGSSASGPSRSPIQAQQGESHNVETLSGDTSTDRGKRTRTEGGPHTLSTLPYEIRLEIVKRSDRTARANLRLVDKALKSAVSEAVTDVKVTKREDLLAAINAYHEGGITTLDLSGSNITDDDLSLLNDLPGLKQLNLSGCNNLTDAGLAHLQHLTSLQQLDLSRCSNLTDAGVAHLQRLTSLQQLNLSRCYNLTDAGLAHLQHLTSLQQLDLSRCDNLTDTQVNLLREQLRNCLVNRR